MGVKTRLCDQGRGIVRVILYAARARIMGSGINVGEGKIAKHKRGSGEHNLESLLLLALNISRLDSFQC